MRIGGMASGMDIDGIMEDLMAAERLPLDKMEQDRTKIEWEQDAYREVNAKFADLDQMMLDMRLSRNYNSKQATTSNDAISATANSSAPEGSFELSVETLASNAVYSSQDEDGNGTGISVDSNDKIDPSKPIADQLEKLGIDDFNETIKFTSYHEGEPDGKEYEIEISDEDSLNDVLTKITRGDNGVSAFYDVQTDSVIMERTEAGAYNDGDEIVFEDNSFFTDVLKLKESRPGTDAEFTYNGVELSSKTNSTTLNNIEYTFNDVTDGTFVNVTNDTEETFDMIMEFVDKYNDLVEDVNGRLREPSNRDYPPLTEAQKNDMSEREIELWEEQAQSGLLRGDSILSGSLSQMRQAWSSSVDNDGPYSHFSEIGIMTTANYLDGGRLQVDEDQLREALSEDADGVHRLFSNSSDDEGRGIINRLDDVVDNTRSRIDSRAGRATQQPHQYTLGREMRNIDNRMESFQRRLQQTEDRYWNQFSAMERAISEMNNQYSQMMSQLGQPM
ncbi:flagellar hook-associated protein 2 [Pelagirhabdus alkalitolerans]|uniref:Flagellar hook-associated protein 2 n=1 Tax=Pelagirhabdus alkalitolerans TaxID=1612202 RepID=A0A1G6MRY6_9BACI|nr:flagellar hook-associated protein 2 [Pelagirhabdus alkalitolerans]SDC58282.1 flagellar hook-associated protein 2 [Pelagirhabdus alkalitolerans]